MGTICHHEKWMSDSVGSETAVFVYKFGKSMIKGKDYYQVQAIDLSIKLIGIYEIGKRTYIFRKDLKCSKT